MVSRLSVLTRDAVDSPAYRYIQMLSPALALSSLINNANGERILLFLLKFIIPNCFRYVVFTVIDVYRQLVGIAQGELYPTHSDLLCESILQYHEDNAPSTLGITTVMETYSAV